MLEALSVRPRICEQIRSGPLGCWVDDFVDVFATRGYATTGMRRHVRAAAIFGAWLDQQRAAATDIDEALVHSIRNGVIPVAVCSARERCAAERGGSSGGAPGWSRFPALFHAASPRRPGLAGRRLIKGAARADVPRGT